ncbi:MULTISPECIES: helix-turn-helix domain-containing protein [Bacillus]|uniref:helix-turn-helix domain-containing protein n=1 Tax=Bacillus TaxID=1386 RepID=UPI0019D456C4|nr:MULTISPECIES: helix-turn-helix domain-containing protein [Bacillus]MDU0070753.1 helix-turn-helix transcriptional regulator [Bacillus sp. IG6]MED8018675.1 helix-turn-helix transcriptional regulator [Bacillus glycinifermentans]WKB75883.1 helix-turn-helix transcriptional regulator [Bacillus glycinifermentans]
MLKVTNFLENYIFIHLDKNYERSGTFVLGPSLSLNITKEMTARMVHDYKIPLNRQSDLLQYFNNVVKISRMELLHAAQLAYFLLFHEKIDEAALSLSVKANAEKMEGAIEKQLYTRRINRAFHMDLYHEQYIWQCIKEGNKDKLAEHLKGLNIDGVGVLSKKSHLRHTKNHAIIAVALATRAAVEGGLYEEIAFTMSDISIQRIEDAKEVNQINLYVQQYLYELIDKVLTNKMIDQSKPIRICKNYVFKHIYEKISIEDLAQTIHLNPIYLSQLFKKETGLSLGKYIQKEKIKEAKKLLVQSDASIAEISSLLHFSDQSYFANAFKKHTGLTPSQYRNNPCSTNALS